MRSNVPILLFIALFIACGEKKIKKIRPLPGRPVRQMTIIIQPFEGLPQEISEHVAGQLRGIYTGKVIIKSAIRFPENTRNNNQTRYRADSLIRYLSHITKHDELIIGLTNKDISTTKGKYPDWGVMGLGYCPGRSCIASTFRLKGKNKPEKLFKVAIHELGHTQGLDHCAVKTCLMRDAEGKDHLDEEKEFCARCKPALISAGWELK